MATKRKCMDCGKDITKKHVRCVECHRKHRQLFYSDSANRRKVQKGKCVDCGSPITKGFKRCRKCSSKNNWVEHRDAMMQAAKAQSHVDAIHRVSIARWSDEHNRILASERTKAHNAEMWKDPEYRQHVADAVGKSSKERWKDKDYKKRMSKIFSAQLTKRWENDSEYRSTVIRATKARLTQQWSDPNYRQHMSYLNKKRGADPEFKRMQSERMKKRWEDPKFREHVSHCARLQMMEQLSDVTSKMYLSHRRFSPSSLERTFKHYLDDAKIRYKQQFRPPNYHRLYDFLLLDFNALVEIDGTFWHHSEWSAENGVPERDAEKDKWACEHGFIMVRIPENDMSADIVPNWLLPELNKLQE